MSKSTTVPSRDFPNFNTLGITSEFSGFEPTESINFVGSASVGQNLQKRAKSKYLNCILMAKMADLKSPLADKYWKTYYCSHQIEVKNDKAKSNFCSMRWCMICNRIRTATLIQTYMPTLDTWHSKSFITLTVPNCEAENLTSTLKTMYESFTKIKDIERKRGYKLKGLRKLECTFNRDENNFHPHYHLIVDNPERNKIIIDEWLTRFPSASRSGQNFKKADNNSCFELFKYFTKLTSNSSKDKSLTTSALDTIFQSIQGVRTFQPFGFIAHKIEPPPDNTLLKENDDLEFEIYNYQKQITDWLSTETGELLTNYTPSIKDEYIKKNIR
jgi:plasmid rolling circle replication initiator protein Rep